MGSAARRQRANVLCLLRRCVARFDIHAACCIKSVGFFGGERAIPILGGAMKKNLMWISALALATALWQAAPLGAQEQPKEAHPAEAKGAEAKPAPGAEPKEESSVTEHSIK